MADELTLNATLAYDKNNAQVLESVVNLLADVTGNGMYARSSYSAPTASTALPLGDVTSPGGWLFIKNTDDTNFVKVQTAASGTEFARLLAGEFAFFRLAPGLTAPALQSDTAACIVSYAVFDL